MSLVSREAPWHISHQEGLGYIPALHAHPNRYGIKHTFVLPSSFAQRPLLDSARSAQRVSKSFITLISPPNHKRFAHFTLNLIMGYSSYYTVLTKLTIRFIEVDHRGSFGTSNFLRTQNSFRNENLCSYPRLLSSRLRKSPLLTERIDQSSSFPDSHTTSDFMMKSPSHVYIPEFSEKRFD